MMASRAGLMLRFALLGSQRLSSALVCSLLARCHGERGSRK